MQMLKVKNNITEVERRFEQQNGAYSRLFDGGEVSYHGTRWCVKNTVIIQDDKKQKSRRVLTSELR